MEEVLHLEESAKSLIARIKKAQVGLYEAAKHALADISGEDSAERHKSRPKKLVMKVSETIDEK